MNALSLLLLLLLLLMTEIFIIWLKIYQLDLLDYWYRRASIRGAGGGWSKATDWGLLLWISVLWHCWLDDRNGILHVKKPVPLMLKGSFPEQVKEETEGKELTQVQWKTAVKTVVLCCWIKYLCFL